MAAPDLGADLVSIGAAARATGTTVTTVRHYDDLGLLPTVTRESGRRRFDAASIERIRLVRGARRLGFTLDEIVALVGGPDDDRRRRLDDQLHRLRAQRTELDAMIDALDELRTCDCGDIESCGTVAELG
ncbi:MAG: MerR family transcriptional regulator [Actinomycetota bacterium]